MKNIQTISLFLFLLMAAFSGGVYFGFNTGIENYYRLEKVLSSNIDVLRAKDLKSGSEKELKGIYWHFEMSINDAMDSYNWYQDSGNHFFSKLFLSGHLEYLEKSIKNIAVYRSLNPLEPEVESLLCEPGSEEDRKYCIKRMEKRKELVQKYGMKS